jgi:hypothetical protein
MRNIHVVMEFYIEDETPIEAFFDHALALTRAAQLNAECDEYKEYGVKTIPLITGEES